MLPATVVRRLIASSLIVAAAASANDTIKVSTIEAAAGRTVSGFVEISPLNDNGTRLPVTLINGANDGPVLTLIAGTHGYEYPGITALQRIRKTLDADNLSGAVILVHVANPPSFMGRTIYYSPADGQNLNRMYPGKSDGTLSERIAHAITTQVIEQSDFLVDLHAGDGNEDLRPYVYMPVTGKPNLDAGSRGLAIAFGLDHIVIDNSRLRSPEDSLYTDQTALTRGIPAITTETGKMGSNDDQWVDLAEAGIWNILRHLNMVDGAEVANTGIVWLHGYEVVRSPDSGMFRAAVQGGYAVAKGTLLGNLVDWFGDEVAEIRAPFAGVVNYVIGTPPVSKGEPLAMISRVGEPE